ncbi:unnamed protein product [Lampetra planeri]
MGLCRCERGVGGDVAARTPSSRLGVRPGSKFCPPASHSTSPGRPRDIHSHHLDGPPPRGAVEGGSRDPGGTAARTLEGWWGHAAPGALGLDAKTDMDALSPECIDRASKQQRAAAHGQGGSGTLRPLSGIEPRAPSAVTYTGALSETRFREPSCVLRGEKVERSQASVSDAARE